jgi:Putative Flp pilus-assembly TadE/G-like
VSPGLRRTERGATAILAAILAVSLFSVGAVAVDMGQVYAKRSALQSNVDMAVIAATAKLDQPDTCSPETVATAETYLTKPSNEVDGQYAVDLGGAPGDNTGFIQCQDWKVSLWAPRSHADFGLAEVMGFDGVDVPAFAAAQVMSPSQSSSMPFYAADGCDSGTQIISDPPPGPSTPSEVPPLEPTTTNPNNAGLGTIDPNDVPSGSSVNLPVRITGTNLDGVTAVGFTTAGGLHEEVTSLTITGTTQIDLTTVPQDVLDEDGIWYVRVFKDANWSATDEALAFTVGSLLFCDGAVNGNFGTLRVARTGVDTADWLPYNIIRGLEPRLAPWPPPVPDECEDGVPPAVTSDLPNEVNDGTNCLWTDPGFPAEPATDALVKGVDSYAGRLDEDTTPGCSRSGGNERTANAPSLGHGLNDDLFTCFLLNGHSIEDAVDGEPGILSADILQSPRFFMVPVVPVDPFSGAFSRHPILEFRPAFLTDQPLFATQANPGTAYISPYNGIEFHGNKIRRVRVVFFDAASIPETAPPVGGEVEYIGSGTRVIVLVE